MGMGGPMGDPPAASSSKGPLGRASSPSTSDLTDLPYSRPKFRPSTLSDASSPSSSRPPLLLPPYITALASPAHFPITCFLSAMKDICLHPERNSALILRADMLPPPPTKQLEAIDEELQAALGSSQGHRVGDAGEVDTRGLKLERMEGWRRRLMPKQVNRDGKLDQKCLFYRHRPPDTDSHAPGSVAGDYREVAVVLLVPEAKDLADIPYYHPPVKRLAFIYESVDPSTENQHHEEEDEPPILGRISIAYLPFPDIPRPLLGSGTGVVDRMPTPQPSAFGGARPLSTRNAPRKRSSLAGPSIGPDGEVTSPRPADTPTSLLASSGQSKTASNNSDNEEQDQQHRLDRTCFALLEKVYKHGYGDMVGYKKRMHHDVVVPRESFQDLYLALKDRHRHLESRKPAAGYTLVDDVKRHVFKVSSISTAPIPASGLTEVQDRPLQDESLPSDPLLPSFVGDWGSQDIAIAAFLMLLWKDMYPARPGSPSHQGDNANSRFMGDDGNERREWDTWGRPPGGFLDLGCGNGLLVHILISEGYSGRGLELRSRRTWPLYPPATRAALIEKPIDLPSWFPTTIEEWSSDRWPGREMCQVAQGCFIIGNHADEITPWIPLLSLLPPTPSPFLSLPCCLHTLDSAFTPSSFSPPPHPQSPAAGFDDGLEGGESRYKAYLMWLGWQGLQAGWKWEKESLRVPSTKGWGIVGRRRWTTRRNSMAEGQGEGDVEHAGQRAEMEDEEELRKCREWALEQVNEVRRKGAFKVREKEGKDH